MHIRLQIQCKPSIFLKQINLNTMTLRYNLIFYIKWTVSREKVHSSVYHMRISISVCACVYSRHWLHVRLMCSLLSNDSVFGKRWSWSDCADAKSDLDLRCLHMPRNRSFAWRCPNTKVTVVWNRTFPHMATPRGHFLNRETSKWSSNRTLSTLLKYRGHVHNNRRIIVKILMVGQK